MSPIRPKLLFPLIGLALFAPIWHLAIQPALFPQVACLVEQPDGSVEKLWGDRACIDNGRPSLVLRAK